MPSVGGAGRWWIMTSTSKWSPQRKSAVVVIALFRSGCSYYNPWTSSQSERTFDFQSYPYTTTNPTVRHHPPSNHSNMERNAPFRSGSYFAPSRIRYVGIARTRSAANGHLPRHFIGTGAGKNGTVIAEFEVDPRYIDRVVFEVACEQLSTGSIYFGVFLSGTAHVMRRGRHRFMRNSASVQYLSARELTRPRQRQVITPGSLMPSEIPIWPGLPASARICPPKIRQISSDPARGRRGLPPSAPLLD
ncbi:hypothetical protein DFH07DRAFT_782438 [Mycena maculata]|uniref:Uncharacterized protein n=1 Tax=Mycena maculata TaxID=230809 RepID=A0AAD7HSS8_9AGAR|nr:hypothetical protein DFH07DRAFT_782438 [Mycena maculata]